jgi:protein phosphatase|tara:strand:+ start:138 stop:884 length:747 start_codon:yes stop_codon:yes gene_type:complete
MKYLIIGDVHADFIPFKRAIDYARENDLHLVSVGDIVDGGTDGAICVNEMLKLLEEGKGSVVKGNHEHKIIRALNGANVILGPPNMITLEQMETDKTFEQEFRVMVEDYCQNYIKLSDTLYITHGGMHQDFWQAEQSGELTKKMTDNMMFGQADYKKTFQHKGQNYPARTYDWRHSVPKDITLIVGHDPAPLSEKPDFDTFQPEPTVYTNDMGGTVIWTDCGAGKGGSLFGLVVNSSTDEIEDTINFS